MICREKNLITSKKYFDSPLETYYNILYNIYVRKYKKNIVRRSNQMSETGTFGQVYENRKTKKSGVFVEKDESRKVLKFLDNATGEPFEVSEASFRSNWRKSKETSAVEVASVPPEDALQEFIDTVSASRKLHFTANPKYSDATEMVIDGITVLCMNKDDGGVRVKVLPDLYTYSSIKDHVVADSLHFNADNHLSVEFICDYETFEEILQSIKDAVLELNLYGYVIE